MLTIDAYKILYQLKENTQKLQEKYPEMNLGYNLYILEHFKELASDVERLKRDHPLNGDAIRLAWVLDYIDGEKFDVGGWSWLFTDSVGSFTFVNDSGQAFSLYVWNPYHDADQPVVYPFYMNGNEEETCDTIEEAIVAYDKLDEFLRVTEGAEDDGRDYDETREDADGEKERPAEKIHGADLRESA